MSKSKKQKRTGTDELPHIEGKGVGPLASIPAIDKAADRYEKAKNKRCEASPGEIAAKGELRDLLIQHRPDLPVNSDGKPFYRRDGTDYVLETKISRHQADEGEARQEALGE